jgi:TolB protein
MQRITRSGMRQYGLPGALGLLGCLGLYICLSSFENTVEAQEKAPVPRAVHPQERHLRNLRQMTLEGENAEAYFSGDDKLLSLQRHVGGPETCDQIYIMDVATAQMRQVSTGKGRTTCGYIFPGNDRFLYSSTHLGGDACPPQPDMSQGYVWAIYDTFDIFTAKMDGSDLRRLTNSPGYDAEATISRDGKKIVFTSVRDGDLELYTMNADGTGVKRLTSEVGYDGGAFFSHDGKQIVYRAYHPTDQREIADFQRLLRQGLVRPSKLDIFVMNADGTNRRQLTRNSAANFAPFFHPDGKRIIFASNVEDQRGREFDLFLINVDGSGMERVTYESGFDGFPMWTSDGRRLVFASNRHGKKMGDTNLFIADWVD